MKEVKILYDSALTLEKRGKYTDAAKFYREIIATDVNFRPAYVNLGAMFARANRHDLAIPLFERALALSEDDSAHFNLGTEYFRTDQLEKARDHLKTALRINPRLLRAHIVLAYLYEKAHKAEKAEVYFKNALKIESTNRLAALGLSVSLSARGKEAEALQVVESFLAVNKEDAGFKNLRAGLLLAVGKTAESKAEFIALAKTSSEYTSFTDHLKEARAEKQGEFEKVFAGSTDKIQERTRRVLELRKKRKERQATNAGHVGNASVTTQEEKEIAKEEAKQEAQDLLDLSFLYLFQGDSEKALQLLFQAKSVGQPAGQSGAGQVGTNPASPVPEKNQGK